MAPLREPLRPPHRTMSVQMQADGLPSHPLFCCGASRCMQARLDYVPRNIHRRDHKSPFSASRRLLVARRRQLDVTARDNSLMTTYSFPPSRHRLPVFYFIRIDRQKSSFLLRSSDHGFNPHVPTIPRALVRLVVIHP